jgi:serine O-acetyltransferase
MKADRSELLDTLISLHRALPAHSPDPLSVPILIDSTLAVLFPHYSGHNTQTREALATQIETIEASIKKLCGPVLTSDSHLADLTSLYTGQLPHFHTLLKEDAEAICKGDPAATSVDEVILAYPGFLAIAVYRIAHWMHLQKVSVVPRMITEYAHRLTGVDIHPGATIGRSFVIDHGTGVVIGETTVIEDNVKIYQGVTLGALSVDKSLANKKRHPTIQRDVVIYANATILGGQTVIGAGSVVGGNVWLTESVAPGSRVYHKQ